MGSAHKLFSVFVHENYIDVYFIYVHFENYPQIFVLADVPIFSQGILKFVVLVFSDLAE